MQSKVYVDKISLNLGVHARNWPTIALQPLKFNSELSFWTFWRARYGQVLKKTQNSRSQYQSQNQFRITKNTQSNSSDLNKIYFTNVSVNFQLGTSPEQPPGKFY